MAFFRDETDYTHRQTGFARYRQLMSFYAFNWLRINMITTAGALPLAAGILYAILTSSLVLLLPLAFLGGMAWGPFLAGQVDGIMRGLRDAPNNWWKNYQKSWRQNWKASLVPGGMLGLLIGLFAFSVYVLYSAEIPPAFSTLALLAAGFSAVLWFNTLYWPQLVLFDQTAALRIRNLTLFTVKHSVKVFFAVVIQLAWILAMILFAPWTLIVIPFLGFWFPIFLALYRIYPDLNEDLKIEEQFIAVEGDPWAKDNFEKENEMESRDPFMTIQTNVWRRLVKETEQKAEGSEKEKRKPAPEVSEQAEGGKS